MIYVQENCRKKSAKVKPSSYYRPGWRQFNRNVFRKSIRSFRMPIQLL